MGQQGGGGDQEVLQVLAAFPFRPLENIVLALDDQPLPSRDVFAPLQQLAAEYKAKINIFHHRTEEGEAGVDRTVERYLGGLDVSFHEVAGGTNVHGRINIFVKETGADLLCMVRRKRGFFEGIFKGSATLKQVYNSPVPLLVLIAD